MKSKLFIQVLLNKSLDTLLTSSLTFWSLVLEFSQYLNCTKFCLVSSSLSLVSGTIKNFLRVDQKEVQFD